MRFAALPRARRWVSAQPGLRPTKTTIDAGVVCLDSEGGRQRGVPHVLVPGGDREGSP